MFAGFLLAFPLGGIPVFSFSSILLLFSSFFRRGIKRGSALHVWTNPTRPPDRAQPNPKSPQTRFSPFLLPT